MLETGKGVNLDTHLAADQPNITALIRTWFTVG